MSLLKWFWRQVCPSFHVPSLFRYSATNTDLVRKWSLLLLCDWCVLQWRIYPTEKGRQVRSNESRKVSSIEQRRFRWCWNFCYVWRLIKDIRPREEGVFEMVGNQRRLRKNAFVTIYKTVNQMSTIKCVRSKSFEPSANSCTKCNPTRT